MEIGENLCNLSKTKLQKMCAEHGKPMSRANHAQCLEKLRVHLSLTHGWKDFSEKSDDEE
eukprot:UN02588